MWIIKRSLYGKGRCFYIFYKQFMKIISRSRGDQVKDGDLVIYDVILRSIIIKEEFFVFVGRYVVVFDGEFDYYFLGVQVE